MGEYRIPEWERNLLEGRDPDRTEDNPEEVYPYRQITEQLLRVGRLIDQNHQLSWEIEKRLEPILGPNPETEAKAKNAEPGLSMSDLANELRRYAEGLEMLLQRQSEFFARIDL